MKLRAIAFRYNIINIVGVIASFILFIMCLSLSAKSLVATGNNIASTDLNYMSTKIEANILFIVLILVAPVLLFVTILTLNRHVVKKFIHNESKKYYEANNLLYDEKEDFGTVNEAEKGYLPNFKHQLGNDNSVNKTTTFDKVFSGELNDLGIKYSIDNFNHEFEKVDNENRRNRKKLFKFSGNAAVINYNIDVFSSSAVVYCNNPFYQSASGGRYFMKQTKSIRLADGQVGYILYNKMTMSSMQMNKLYSVIPNNPHYFSGEHRVFAIFRGNRFVYMTDKDHIFKLKIPFLIRKATIDKLLWNQKGNVYRFNMFLNKVAVMFR